MVGVGLFSLRHTEIRATLLEGVDEAPVAQSMRAALPPDADPSAAAALLGWSGSPSEAAAVEGDTIQQRLDRRIDHWLNRHVAAYANRKTMYQEAIDLPVRLALERRERRRAGRMLASSYEIGPGYAPSLLALETIARSMAAIGVPVLVVVLPFDTARPPVPYDAATQARIVSDVRAVAERNGAHVLDLGDALESAELRRLRGRLARQPPLRRAGPRHRRGTHRRGSRRILASARAALSALQQSHLRRLLRDRDDRVLDAADASRATRAATGRELGLLRGLVSRSTCCC